MEFEANNNEHESLIKELYPDNNSPITGLNWTKEFTVTQEEASKYDKPDWLYKNLVIGGHIIAIPAPANGGKTTIFMYVAGEMSKQGIKVYYVNADIGQSDAKAMIEYANNHNFEILLPDMKEGQSMDNVVNNLKRMNNEGGDFSGMVFIFDTLKKMTDVINKSRAKDLYKMLRGLSAKGMTIILLAHTNKYKDSEGRPIYEGTGDLRTDVDELIYLVPKSNDDGGLTVSTEPDKVRGKFVPITFEIDKNRTVKQADNFVDVISITKRNQQLENDTPTIESITEAINQGHIKQSDIISFCKDKNISKRSVQPCLKRYADGNNQKWSVEKGFEHNTYFYKLISTPPPQWEN